MAQFPSDSSAYGIWSLSDQRDAVRGDNWPSLAPPDQSVDYVIVAGGGGGGWDSGGGGGAGGMISGTLASVSAGTYTVTVGSGGVGGISSGDAGDNGTNSSFAAEGTTVLGGGGGGTIGD